MLEVLIARYISFKHFLFACLFGAVVKFAFGSGEIHSNIFWKNVVFLGGEVDPGLLKAAAFLNIFDIWRPIPTVDGKYSQSSGYYRQPLDSHSDILKSFSMHYFVAKHENIEA